MRKIIVILTSIFSLLVFTTPIFAHPGRTANDGCHYCRTNCASWGEVEGARHCHGGAPAVETPVYVQPTQRIEIIPTRVPPQPTRVPTLKPTKSPTRIPTVRPTIIPTVKITPEPTKIASNQTDILLEKNIEVSPTKNPTSDFSLVTKSQKPAKKSFFRWLFRL